jgi:hypothetical protein
MAFSPGFGWGVARLAAKVATRTMAGASTDFMITSWDSGLPRTVTLLESGDHEVSQEFVICVKESEFLVIVFSSAQEQWRVQRYRFR